MAEGVGLAVAEGVAVGERAGRGVPVGDAERVGVSFGVDVADVVGGDVDRAGSVEVEVEVEGCCPVVERLPAVVVDAGVTSTQVTRATRKTAVRIQVEVLTRRIRRLLSARPFPGRPEG